MIEGAQPPGPVDEAEMLDDGDRQGHTAMEDSNPQTDTQHPSTSANQQPASLGATGQPAPAIQFTPDAIANLAQAAAAGNFWDIPDQLKGATAAHMQELHAVLQKMASSQKLADTDPQQDESGPDDENILVHRTSRSASAGGDSSSSSGSSSDSDTASETGSHQSTTQKRRTPVKGVKDLFDQAEDDVFIVSDGSEDECGSVRDDDACPTWSSRVSQELDWMVRYPNAVPYVHTRVVSIDDGWYRGVDCASPSEVAHAGKNAILPAADGSLALKADAVLPGAPPGRTKYGNRFLERESSMKRLNGRVMKNWTLSRKPSWMSEQRRTGCLWLATAFGPKKWNVPSIFQVRLTPP